MQPWRREVGDLMIGILDSGSAGNVASVANAFGRAGAPAKIMKTAGRLEGMDGLVVPGVGAFSTVPKIESALGGDECIGKITVPTLCICLGMQALFDSSEENRGTRGLGMIGGKVRRIRGDVRLPQLGWNRVLQTANGRRDPLFAGIGDGEYFYFANSFAAFPKDSGVVLGTAKYGEEFASAVRKGNFWGVQFHPEKSGKAGQRLIGNFFSICSNWKVKK